MCVSRCDYVKSSCANGWPVGAGGPSAVPSILVVVGTVTNSVGANSHDTLVSAVVPVSSVSLPGLMSVSVVSFVNSI